MKDPGIDGSSLVKVFSVLVDGTIDRRDYNKLVGLRLGQKRLNCGTNLSQSCGKRLARSHTVLVGCAYYVKLFSIEFFLDIP